MRKVKILLMLAIMALPTQQLLAWGKIGHRVVAQVAYDNLNCIARHRVDKLLGKDGMIYQANWPDEIKSDTIYPTSYDWHYQDFDPNMTDAEVVNTLTNYPTKGGNLFRAMDSLIDLLHHDRNNVDALRFVIHLTGDRFCPMHTAHLDDMGGNKVRLKWFGEDYNLHRIWDEGIIENLNYSYSEFAKRLEIVYSSEKKSIRKMTWAEITLHNYHLCNSIYDYYDNWNGNCYQYVYHFTPSLEWQLYASGIRLAMILNEIYG